MSYTSIDTSHERTEKYYNYGLEAGMGQSASRPKKQPEAPPQEEEGWGLFHHGPAISGPEQNSPPGDRTPENTEHAPGEDEIQHGSTSQAEDATQEDENQIEPTASHVSDSAQHEQDKKSDSLGEEPDRSAETTAHGNNTGAETGNVQTSESTNATERENGDQGADLAKDGPRVPDRPHKPAVPVNARQPVPSHPADGTPYSWFDMIIDLDDPEPLGPTGYFPGPSTMPDLPPLGPRTSIQVL
ncbi:hypothetical protein CLAIMM_09423 [Cladophialophora immunda]|nr:hypothetical protein CLAIMM_09423 [Cladophialophora immunda]